MIRSAGNFFLPSRKKPLYFPAFCRNFGRVYNFSAEAGVDLELIDKKRPLFLEPFSIDIGGKLVII
jgi:hypothetical protein